MHEMSIEKTSSPRSANLTNITNTKTKTGNWANRKTKNMFQMKKQNKSLEEELSGDKQSIQ